MNRESLTQLKSAQKIASKPAYLQKAGQDKGFYAFNYNPESYTDSLSANYSSVSAATSDVPYLDFDQGSGITRSFSGLLMDTYSDGKSLRAIIEGIKDLMKAHPDKGEFEPPDVEFHWGSESFNPCKITNFSYTITHWLGGEPAKGTCDLTLTLVPISDPAKLGAVTSAASEVATKTQQAIAAQTTTISTLPVVLTARQQIEGQAIALANINTNISTLPPTIQNAIKTRRYRVSLDQSGNAVLLNPSGVELLNVGVYDGVRFISKLLKNKNAASHN